MGRLTDISVSGHLKSAAKMVTYPNIKINIGLNVLRKRPDGYHDIETLFYPSHEFHDVLEIIGGDDYSRTSAMLFSKYGTEGSVSQAISEDGRLMVTIARQQGVDWNPLEDLCARAYRLLDNDFSLPPVKIFLEKLSPVGAGLGGGSSDAAFTLRMLSEMFSLGLDEKALAGYAARLGSDCAFFVYNRPMFGEGRGDLLSECSFSDLSGYEIRIVAPEGISISTSEAYRGIVPEVPEIPLKEVLARPVCEWAGHLHNDFEKTVFAQHPALAAIKQSLYDSGAVYASMSGSGSALFAIYPSSDI